MDQYDTRKFRHKQSNSNLNKKTEEKRDLQADFSVVGALLRV
jgi:hypothetical protein